MTGLAGGTITGRELAAMGDALAHEPWYGRETYENGAYGVELLHHGGRDPRGATCHKGDGLFGAVYGAITNCHTGDLTAEMAFDRLQARPDYTLERIDGPFALVCLDERNDRLLLATDKLGTRPIYYATVDDGLLFGSELKAVQVRLDGPTLDEQAVNDLLLLGHMWGERTLLEEVRSLPPATVLEYDGEDVTTRRYWQPDYEPAAPTREYDYELGRRYQQSVASIAATMPDSVGLWLSGGLDSRQLAVELRRTLRNGDRRHALRAYTYDANPAGGGNPEIAGRVADHLNLPVTELTLSPGRFVETVERAIDVTDGMIRWNTLLNLTAMFDIVDTPGVLVEGAGQGELIGHHLRKRHLTGMSTPLDSLVQSEASLDPDIVRGVVNTAVDPYQSLRDEIDRSPASGKRETVLDVHYQNYYARHTLASNHLVRRSTGTRVPFMDRSFLEHAAKLPDDYRMKTVPLTRGRIPFGAAPAKLALMRELDATLATIPYERTSVPPKYPLPFHVLGFVGSVSLARLRSKTTYGGTGMVDEWYRHDDTFRDWLDGLIDGAIDRSLFDADLLETARQEHLDRESNNIDLLAPVTTLEFWLRRTME